MDGNFISGFLSGLLQVLLGSVLRIVFFMALVAGILYAILK